MNHSISLQKVSLMLKRVIVLVKPNVVILSRGKVEKGEDKRVSER